MNFPPPSQPNPGGRNPLPSKAFPGFTQQPDHAPEFAALHAFRRPHEKPRPASLLRYVAQTRCTISCHPPVDALHSIENKSDKSTTFSLTQNLKRVQQDRSLTAS
jgi:hypothetical protein